MTSSLAELKKRRKQDLDSLADKMEGTNNKTSKDERFWSLTVDKAGNGSAVIRFLPSPKGEDDPFVQMNSYGFKGPGGWYIENSRTTIGQNDPVAELNTKEWSRDGLTENDKRTLRQRNRIVHYIMNILVIKDAANPSNEGRVFLYKCPKTVLDKIKEAIRPVFEDQAPIDPFDFWEGANFRLRCKQKDNFRSYEDSSFENPSEISNNDAVLDDIWGKEYPLQPFLDQSNFKSYDELATRLKIVLGGKPSISNSNEDISTRPEREEFRPPKEDTGESTFSKGSIEDDDDDDIASFLASLDDD